ncbi:MAG: 6-pyruvoyl-tetrahydropterin synthase-related protein [bacterium]
MKKETIIDLFFLLLTFFFFFLYFEPRYLFLSNTITGGDIASHYHITEYLKNVLLPQGKIMGWTMDNFCGYPLFYHYFPLPFILAAVAGYFFPLAISFKLVSVTGVFFFPLAVYLMFRFLRYEFPIPIIASLFSLAYLFNPWQAMWGGNIMSVLVGEFCQSFSMLFFLVAIGSLYRGINENKYLFLNAVLVALMALSHGIPISLFVVVSSYFLFNQPWKNLWYLIKIYSLGFLLISYWFIPFLFNIPYTTPLTYAYAFNSPWEIFPPILIPFFLLSVYALATMLKARNPRLKSGVLLFPTLQCGVFDSRILYFIFIIIVSFLLGLAAPRIGLIDSRYFTFVQLFLTLIGAISLQSLFSEHKRPVVVFFSILFVFLTISLWLKVNCTKIKSHIDWNYSGVETRASWPDFIALTKYLRETPGGGRVAVENTYDLIEFGTPRIFESLKSFAGRDTLKGLLVSSSITTPFIRQIEAEISNNPKLAATHLKMCGATQLIARTEKLKKQLQVLTEYKFEKRFGSCEVYRVVGSDPRYIPLAQTEKIGQETVEFTTTRLNQPHLIKISYHPNWVVAGADKIYRVRPSFMMVRPKQKNVKLVFNSFWKSVGR